MKHLNPALVAALITPTIADIIQQLHEYGVVTINITDDRDLEDCVTEAINDIE